MTEAWNKVNDSWADALECRMAQMAKDWDWWFNRRVWDSRAMREANAKFADTLLEKPGAILLN